MSRSPSERGEMPSDAVDLRSDPPPFQIVHRRCDSSLISLEVRESVIGQRLDARRVFPVAGGSKNRTPSRRNHFPFIPLSSILSPFYFTFRFQRSPSEGEDVGSRGY